MQIEIRKAKGSDLTQAYNLIKELAVFENEPDAVEITVAELEKDYETGLFDCFVALFEDRIVGMALYYNRYSTWKGKTIHLEDLVVSQFYRGKGIGKQLLDAVINEAKRQKVRRLEWCVLDWNKNAIDFYEKTGANILKDWYLVQMDQEGINKS